MKLLNGNLQRWGDYSGSQRRYNNPGEVWMSGFYSYAYSGGFPWAHAAWIAQIKRDTTVVVDTTNYVNVLNTTRDYTPANVYPNPAQDYFSVEFSLDKVEYLSFELYDARGKLVKVLLRDWIKINKHLFSFKTSSLDKGLYILKIQGNYGTIIEKKLVID